MDNKNVQLLSIIQDLKQMDVDGETMQFILKQVGMEWQMLRQLMLTMPMEQIGYLLEEREELEPLLTNNQLATSQFIVENGMLVDKYPCDVNVSGDQQSNGSQEFIYTYKNNDYCVWMDWDNKPILPNEILSPIEK